MKLMSLSIVKENVIANFAGKASTVVLSLIFIPVYIKLMGIEAYGIIGLFLSLTALLSILDMGLSSTLSRELARLSISRDNDQEARDLLRTLEVVYWSIGICLGLGLIALAPVIVRFWINPAGISPKTIEQVLKIMGLVVAIQWPASLYSGGLMGLQRQVLLNGIKVGIATIQHAGAVLLLLFISPSVVLFFAWQIVAGIANILCLSLSLWKSLPSTSQKAIFKRYLINKNWKFAAGMTGISIAVTILTQLDKIILSKLLSLTLFGYYTLAFTIANNISQLVGPFSSALFPKFSQMIITSKDDEISSLYHKACQLVSIIVLPVASILILFSKDIISLWLSNADVVENTHLLLSLLIIGSTINALLTIPYTLQLAYGWTRLVFYQNVISIMLVVPCMIFLTRAYGAVGAALVWIALNLAYLIVLIPIMHRRILKAEMSKWYIIDTGFPLAVVLIISYISSILRPADVSNIISASWIFATFILATSFAVMSLPFGRAWIVQHFNKELLIL